MTGISGLDAAFERLINGTGNDPRGFEIWWENEAAAVRDPRVPLVISAMCRGWEALPREQASSFAVAVVEKAGSPLVLADTLDELLTCEPALEAVAERLSTVLLARSHRDDEKGELATRSLEGALRLGLGSWAENRLSVLVALTKVPRPDSPFAFARLCRLLGVADEQWPTPELVDRLEREVDAGDETGDASFELGLALLRRALEANPAEALDRFHVAYGLLDSATRSIESRTDAGLYAHAIHAALAFADGDREALEADTHMIRELVADRVWWRASAESTWLSPRSEAEMEWQHLVEMLRTALATFDAPWLHPSVVLEQLVETYSASRSLSLVAWKPELARGVDVLIEPRIEDELLRDAYRVELLARWIETEEIGAAREDAEELLRAVRAGGGSKKARTSGSHPSYWTSPSRRKNS